MERLLALAFFGMFLMAVMAMGTGEVLDASGTGAKHTVSRDLSQHVSANAAEGSALVLNPRKTSTNYVTGTLTVAFLSSLPQPTIAPLVAVTTDLTITQYITWR